MDYGYALIRAWKITWKYKVLWIFGILAGCRANGNGGGNSNFSQDYTDMPPEILKTMERGLNFIQRPEVIVGLVLLVLFIIAITIFFSTIGRVALISGTYQAEAGAEKLFFGELFKKGTSHFWHFFGMNILVSLPFIIVILGLLGAGVFRAVSAGNTADAEAFMVAFLPTFCILFCCLFIFSLIVGLILQQASNAMVLENLGISASLIRGWEVFKSNIGHLLLIAIILFIFGAVAGLAIGLPFLMILIPTMVAFVLGEAQSAQPLITMGLCIAAYLPFFIIAHGILTTYGQAVWTLFYLQITEQTPEIEKEDTIIEYA